MNKRAGKIEFFLFVEDKDRGISSLFRKFLYHLVIMIKFAVINWKCRMEYKFAFVSGLFVQALSYVARYLTIWVVLTRFQDIKGWSFYEVAFLYSLGLLSYALAAFFFFGLSMGMDNMVRNGLLDGLLIRPLHPLFQMIARSAAPAYFSHIGLSTYVLLFSSYKMGITWTFSSVFWFIIVLVGAALIQASLMAIPAILSFWVIRSRNLVRLSIGTLHRFIQYPITIYSKWIRIFLTFAIPYAFVSFYPSLHFLNKQDLSLFHPLVQYLTPILGFILFMFTLFLWKQGLKRYQSTGS